ELAVWLVLGTGVLLGPAPESAFLAISDPPRSRSTEGGPSSGRLLTDAPVWRDLRPRALSGLHAVDANRYWNGVAVVQNAVVGADRAP
ncbi:MAG: hypothetical protein KGL16_13090, partial [Acidobacteriota bacterium]|nr:hypothetical protein [Acidobacteriota bacterium]